MYIISFQSYIFVFKVNKALYFLFLTFLSKIKSANIQFIFYLQQIFLQIIFGTIPINLNIKYILQYKKHSIFL